jgi:NADPH-dependent curcumin reductase CurA
VCGVVAHYNDTTRPTGVDRLPGFFGQLLVKSLTVRGFIQTEFADEMHLLACCVVPTSVNLSSEWQTNR